MIDSRHLIYAGTLAVFLVCVHGVAVRALVVLAAVIVTVSVCAGPPEAQGPGPLRGPGDGTGNVVASGTGGRGVK